MAPKDGTSRLMANNQAMVMGNNKDMTSHGDNKVMGSSNNKDTDSSSRKDGNRTPSVDLLITGPSPSCPSLSTPSLEYLPSYLLNNPRSTTLAATI